MISYQFFFFFHFFYAAKIIFINLSKSNWNDNLTHSSYEQQSLAVNDIFPALPPDTMIESSVLIKIRMHEKNEDDDSCFTDDDGLQFGDMEY